MSDNVLAEFVINLNKPIARGSYAAVPDETVDGNWLVEYHPKLFRSGRTVYDENTQQEAEVIAALCNLLNKEDWDDLEPLLRQILPDSFPDCLGDTAAFTRDEHGDAP